MPVRAKKELFDQKLCGFLDEYDKGFLVHADFVGSKQFADIRFALRSVGETRVLMGKNTLTKRSIRAHAERTGETKWLGFLDLLVGNVGLVFTKGDFNDVRAKIAEYKVGAPAKAGVVAPVSVTVPAGGTGMDPSQTSFFQALNIATKINKGSVEILNDCQVVTAGERVGSSEAALLAKLGIKPFEYGLEIQKVFEGGNIFDAAVLDIKDEDLLQAVGAAIGNVTRLSLGLSYPSIVAVPHLVCNGYKNLLKVALATDYVWPLAQKIKTILDDPEALAAMMAASSGGGGGGGGGAAAAAKAPEPEPEEEEEEEEAEFDLFD